MVVRLRMSSICLTAIFFLGSLRESHSFSTRSFSSTGIPPTFQPKTYVKCSPRHQRSCTTLQLASNQFDISKPVFDLLSLRTVRGDALIRYSSLNQSEPLRINLFALLALVLFAAPTLSEALGNEEMGIVGTVFSVLAGVGSIGLFLREVKRRDKQLVRIEKELNTEYLQLRLPTNALADQRFTKPASLEQLRKLSNPPRIIAICGSKLKLKQSLKSLAVLGRRLQQASAYVVVVPTDGSTWSDWSLPIENPKWLAAAEDAPSWITYFDELSPDDISSQFRWFGLNSNGRSFGSGAGESPQWLQVLGRNLRPTALLGETDATSDYNSGVTSVLKAQANFYEALTTGKLEAMNEICSKTQAPEVSEVLEAGGRVDDWNSCLADGARPEGMVISGSDGVLVSDTQAYSTVIEFPANTGMDAATLLAVQQWGRSSASEEWKLELHETIPWSPETKAQGTLRCDCRGCVALTRVPEQRTFGGLIGL